METDQLALAAARKVEKYKKLPRRRDESYRPLSARQRDLADQETVCSCRRRGTGRSILRCRSCMTVMTGYADEEEEVVEDGAVGRIILTV